MTKLKKTLPNDLARFCMNHERDWCEPIIEKLKEMLSECEPDATTRGGNKYTVLHYTNIPVEIVAWQIERGATVDAPHTYGTQRFPSSRRSCRPAKMELIRTIAATASWMGRMPCFL